MTRAWAPPISMPAAIARARGSVKTAAKDTTKPADVRCGAEGGARTTGGSTVGLASLKGGAGRPLSVAAGAPTVSGLAAVSGGPKVTGWSRLAPRGRKPFQERKYQ